MTTSQGSKCPLGVAFKRQSGIAVPLVCGSWNCKDCAKYLARHWAGIARYGMLRLGVQCYFWTLTLPGYVESVPYAYYIIPKLWDGLRKDIQRNTGSWPYLAFVEGQPQRSFMPHFHILSAVGSYRRLKDLAVHHGFGHQANEQEISSDGAVDYVSKYASKQGHSAPKGFRRVRCSSLWPRPPKPVREAYLVKRQRETISAFLLRVSSITGRDVSTLWGSYQILMGHEEGWDDLAFARTGNL
jgi:hypothetical protein